MCLCITFVPQIKGAIHTTFAVGGLHLNVDWATSGQQGQNQLWGSINTHVISMHNLNFAMKTTQTESVLLLHIPTS